MAEDLPNDREGQILICKDISDWFKEVQVHTPRLRRLRLAAVDHLLKGGLTRPEVAALCGISEHKVRELCKDLRGGHGT